MEQVQSVDSQYSKIILKNEQPEDGLGPQNQSFCLNLSYDHGINSLALGVQRSIENGMPIPRNMLSHSDDIPLQEEEPEQNNYFNRVKLEPTEEDKLWLEEELDLKDVIYSRKGPTNTKNVLRNFGNAQNQYILYHRDAKAYVE
jgi:hypothetical protein